MNKYVISLGMLILFTPFFVNAGFDKSAYYLGDSIFFDPIDFGNVDDGEEVFIYLFSDVNTGREAEIYIYSESTGNTQVVPSTQIDADTFRYIPLPITEVLLITDLPEGTWNWVFETDVNADCDSNDDFATCSVGAWANGSFTISHSEEPTSSSGITSEQIDTIQSNMLSSAVTGFTANIGQILTFLASFMVLALLLALGKRFFLVGNVSSKTSNRNTR
jgi:hypothetical protein